MTNGTWIVEECRLKNPDWENLVTVVVDPELEHTSARSLARELGQVKTLLCTVQVLGLTSFILGLVFFSGLSGDQDSWETFGRWRSVAGVDIFRAETLNAVHPGRERRFEPARGRRVGQPPEVVEAPARFIYLGRCRGIKGILFLLLP